MNLTGIDARGNVFVQFDKPNGYHLDGIGAELDPHLFRDINTRHGVNEQDWELLCKRIQGMKLHKIRMMIMPEWYEPENDNDDPFVTDFDAFTWDSEAMQSVYRILDMAEEFGIRVNLTLWGAHASQNSWLAIPGCVHWVSPPNDLDEWSENFCALLTWLIKVKGYTCIQEITPYNEPNPAYYVKTTAEVNFQDYKRMVMNLEKRLIREGLRDCVELCTGDDGGVFSWMLECSGDPEFEAISDSMNSHFYYFPVHGQLSDIAAKSAEITTAYQKNTKKDFRINEFGCYWDDGGDWKDLPQNNSFERGLLYGKMITVLLGDGCTGMLHWCLFDEYYNDWQKMYRGLWRFKDEGWTVRPAFHAISLVTRHTIPGSALYKGITQEKTVAATALQFDSGWTYLLVNDGHQDVTVEIDCVEMSGVHKQYIYCEQELPENGTEVLQPVAEVLIEKHHFGVTLPAKSFTVLN